MSDIGGGTSVNPVGGILPLSVDPGIPLFINGKWVATSLLALPSIGWSFRKTWTGEDDIDDEDGSDYHEVLVFEFPGTASGAMPNKARAVISTKKKDGNVNIRLVSIDSTPPSIVFDSSSLAALDGTPVAFDMGVIANLPPAPALMSLQVKNTTSKSKTVMHDFVLDRA